MMKTTSNSAQRILGKKTIKTIYTLSRHSNFGESDIGKFTQFSDSLKRNHSWRHRKNFGFCMHQIVKNSFPASKKIKPTTRSESYTGSTKQHKRSQEKTLGKNQLYSRTSNLAPSTSCLFGVQCSLKIREVMETKLVSAGRDSYCTLLWADDQIDSFRNKMSSFLLT